jgi:hypothetical protein
MQPQHRLSEKAPQKFGRHFTDHGGYFHRFFCGILAVNALKLASNF